MITERIQSRGGASSSAWLPAPTGGGQQLGGNLLGGLHPDDLLEIIWDLFLSTPWLNSSAIPTRIGLRRPRAIPVDISNPRVCASFGSTPGPSATSAAP